MRETKKLSFTAYTLSFPTQKRASRHMSASRLIKTSEFKRDKDTKYSDELKDIPVVAKYDDWVRKHTWLNSTELLFKSLF